MTIELSALPYAPDALAPAISGSTVRYHYEHHHAGYVTTVNRLVKGTDLESATLEHLIAVATGPLVNAAAQVWNHAFYWASMAPAKGKPDAALLCAIDQSFGTPDTLASEFKSEASQLFGSGWTWLVVTEAGKLSVLSTPNAGLRLHEDGLYPLLVCDVWEHAYYLDYRGDRASYLDAFWGLVNWQAASDRFARART